jgi:hypothetical protein
MGLSRPPVTFMSEFEVRAHIDECIEAACLASIESQHDAKVAAALLTHREQRFRLCYIFGDWNVDERTDQDDFSFNAPPSVAAGNPDEEDTVSEDEQHVNGERIGHCFSETDPNRHLVRIVHRTSW